MSDLCDDYYNKDEYIIKNICIQHLLITKQIEFFITTLQNTETIADHLKIAMYVLMLNIESSLHSTVYTDLEIYPIENLKELLQNNFKSNYPTEYNKFKILKELEHVKNRDIIFTLTSPEIIPIDYPTIN